jgi:hypothetical protein
MRVYCVKNEDMNIRLCKEKYDFVNFWKNYAPNR